jgi:hypothetical protein
VLNRGLLGSSSDTLDCVLLRLDHRCAQSQLRAFGRTNRNLKLHFLLNDGDQGTTSKDLVQVPIGPVTRARAKKFKDVLNGLIQELWAQANSWRPIDHDPRGQQRIVTLIQVLEGSGQGQELARNSLGLFEKDRIARLL